MKKTKQTLLCVETKLSRINHWGRHRWVPRCISRAGFSNV